MAKEIVYPCYETPDELELKRKSQLLQGLPPIYDRTALALTPEVMSDLERSGRKPYWRFRLSGVMTSWDDLLRGHQEVDTSSVSDPIVRRADGTYLYTLCSVIDDIDMGITHVIRGDDHITNAGVQLEMFYALGGSAPCFGHHNLLSSISGEALSKRLGSLSIRSLREEGLEPEAVRLFAVLTGSAIESAAQQLDDLSLEYLPSMSKSVAKFDLCNLRAINARIVHNMSYEKLAPRFSSYGISLCQSFWEAVRPNCQVVADAYSWWNVLTGTRPELAPSQEDLAFLKFSAGLLPQDPWDNSTWGTWIDAIKNTTDRKGKDLFITLRLALTGRDYGPEMKFLLPIIGRVRALDRLRIV